MWSCGSVPDTAWWSKLQVAAPINLAVLQVQAVKAEAQQRRVSKRTQSLAPQLQQQQQQQPSACSSREGSDRGVGTSVEPCDLHVDQLLALCPADISRPFIAHLLLQGFKGDIQVIQRGCQQLLRAEATVACTICSAQHQCQTFVCATTTTGSCRLCPGV